jgi:hypothetical protein
MPANLIQTRHNSMVFATGTSTLRVKEKAEHRMSVASFSSIESVAEEVMENGEAVRSTSLAPNRPRAVSRRSASPPNSRSPSISRPSNPSRHSLPASPYHGGYQSFSMSAISNESSGPKQVKGTMSAATEEEERDMSARAREKREERRWRIAEELKETEKAYVQVLEEIDAVHFPLLVLYFFIRLSLTTSLAALLPTSHHRSSRRPSIPPHLNPFFHHGFYRFFSHQPDHLSSRVRLQSRLRLCLSTLPYFHPRFSGLDALITLHRSLNSSDSLRQRAQRSHPQPPRDQRGLLQLHRRAQSLPRHAPRSRRSRSGTTFSTAPGRVEPTQVRRRPHRVSSEHWPRSFSARRLQSRRQLQP